MKNVFSILALGLFSAMVAGVGVQSSRAEDPAQETAAPLVCTRSLEDVQKLALEAGSRLSLWNHGGLLGDGVCWWHSRFQRAGLYLTLFRPDLPKPSRDEAARLIDTLSGMKAVVVIPGYVNFNAFSRDFEIEIQSRLESWQREDGFLRFRWVEGLKGHPETSAGNLSYIMEQIHEMVAVQHRIVFEKLALHGIGTHAWLIISSTEKPDGYVIEAIDSNGPGNTVHLEFHEGDTSLHMPFSGHNFVPYLNYDGDLVRIFRTLDKYCDR